MEYWSSEAEDNLDYFAFQTLVYRNIGATMHATKSAQKPSSVVVSRDLKSKSRVMHNIKHLNHCSHARRLENRKHWVFLLCSTIVVKAFSSIIKETKWETYTWKHTCALGIISARSRNWTLLPAVFHLSLQFRNWATCLNLWACVAKTAEDHRTGSMFRVYYCSYVASAT